MTLVKREPEEYAVELLRYFRIDRVGDISTFAAKLGLKIREVPSQTFDGALVRIPKKMKGIVAVRDTIRESGRKAFTIAHEIAHFILPGHGTSECICTAKDINSWQAHVARQQEVLANRFASELLLPAASLYKIVNHRKATLTLAKGIATEYSTSLTAAAIKCVDITEEACAVVWSVNGEAKWVHKNESFRRFINIGRLDNNSHAGYLFSDHQVPTREGEVDPEVWLSLKNGESHISLWEDSYFVPYYDAVITILTVD